LASFSRLRRVALGKRLPALHFLRSSALGFLGATRRDFFPTFGPPVIVSTCFFLMRTFLHFYNFFFLGPLPNLPSFFFKNGVTTFPRTFYLHPSSSGCLFFFLGSPFLAFVEGSKSTRLFAQLGVVVIFVISIPPISDFF